MSFYKYIRTLSIASAISLALVQTSAVAKAPLSIDIKQANISTKLTQSQIQQVLQEAYNKFKNDDSGKNADYIKALAKVDSKIFGITLVTKDGKVYEIGDTKAKVSIQSISKVFTVTKVMQEKGSKFIQDKIGVNATGLPAKSGVGGRILAVVPGKMGIGVVSPRLDKYGNSIRVQKAISYIVEKLHLNPYAR